MLSAALSVLWVMLMLIGAHVPLFPPQLAQAEMGWDEPFSYLHALEEGYFSDAVVTAEGGKQVGVSLCQHFRG